MPLNLDSSCLAFWDFSFGDGRDSTPNNHDLTVNGSPGWFTGEDGPLGTLYGFVPSDANYLSAGAGFRTAFSSSSDFTVFQWVYATAYSAAAASMSWGTANANQVCVAYPHQTSNGNGMAVYCNGGGYKFDLNNGVPALNGWHNWALSVLSNSSAILYVDGVQVGTSALDLTNFPSMTGFHVGRYHNGSQPYTSGQVGPCGVWEPHLSADEILTLSEGAVYPFTSTVVRPVPSMKMGMGM